eukprot:m.26431 g.26431  ORF g.26431 m.26431 type:complete len:289 (+) comp4316_c0_seq1:122-988(+)
MPPGSLRTMEGGQVNTSQPPVSRAVMESRAATEAASMLLMMESHIRHQSASRSPSPPRTNNNSQNHQLSSGGDSRRTSQPASPMSENDAAPSLSTHTSPSQSGNSARHSCPICFKTFVSQSKVRRHYLVHTKDKPFHCNMCSTRFTQKSALKVHVQKKHGDCYDEESFKRAADSQTLAWHQRDHASHGTPATPHPDATFRPVAPVSDGQSAAVMSGGHAVPTHTRYMTVAPGSDAHASMMYYQMVPVMRMPMGHQSNMPRSANGPPLAHVSAFAHPPAQGVQTLPQPH